MIEVKNFDGDVSVGRNAVVGGDAKVCGGMTVGKNLKVEGWLDAKNIKGSNKGLFVDEASLKKAYPVPQDGWWALVGETMPAALWVAYGGEWSNTGGTGGEITVESQQIEALIERFEEEMQSMRDVNETQTNNIVALSNATNTNAAEIEAVKSKNAEQDELLAASVAADAAHDEEISALKSKDTAHDEEISALKSKEATHDEEISALKSKDTTHDSRIEKLEERVLQYLYPKIYQLNEGAGALKFNGFTEAEGSGGLLLTKDTYKYNVLYSTAQKQFVLNVTDEAGGVGVRVGTFAFWNEIILPNGSRIASSESYAQRDCLYYIYVSGEGSTYYYIDSNGKATEQSATFLLRKLIDDLSANLDTAKASLNAKDTEQDRTIVAIQAKNTEQDGAIDSLEAKNNKQDARINELLQDTPWDGQHMNAFTETGEYYIHGERTDANDGLPILNAASGHTIEARLTVLDSSLTNGTGEETDIVVTQILRLSNRTGGDGHVYVRTGQAATKSKLAIQNSTAWGTWEKLMGVFEKNAVSNATDLNEYTSSGMYDGMFVFSSTSQTAVSGLKIESGSTFLMVAVNGYAVAQTGVVPQVTQLLYVMPSGLDGSSGVRNAKLYTRTGIYAATTKTYTWSKFDGLAYASDITKLLGYIQDNSDLIQENQSAISANTKEIARVNSTATRAQETADRAQEAANTAQTTADSASSAAATAQTAAETAQSAADTAQETANSARGTAVSASTAAQEAQTAADNAQETANKAQTKNNEQDARLEAIENSVSHLSAAGRYWNEANGTPTAAGHYGSLDALRSLPEMLGLGRYLVKDDRTRRKLDPKDSKKYADNGTDAKLDGTDGQCMWCWNGFYANVWKEGDNLFKVVSFDRPVGNDISIWIPAGGISWLGAGVIDRGEAPYTDKTKWKLCSVINNSEQFIGGGGTALDASKFSKAPAAESPQITMLGMPATNISTTDFGKYARKRGVGWEANWFVARFVVEFLFEVIMGTENSQEAFNANKDANGLYQGGFGIGVTTFNGDWGTYNGLYPIIPTSVGLEAGDGVCMVQYSIPNSVGADSEFLQTFNIPVFFGLVHAGYGHLHRFIRGVVIDEGKEKTMAYVTRSMYADYDPVTVSDKILVAECPRAQGYIKQKSYRGLGNMATEVGGSSTTRYSDNFYTNEGASTGLRIKSVGGNVSGYGHCGISCTDIRPSSNSTGYHNTAPLCYFTEDPIIPESQSIANNS